MAKNVQVFMINYVLYVSIFGIIILNKARKDQMKK